MKLCEYDCIPCCDFCIYAIHDTYEQDGKIIELGPIGCKLHTDEKHQNIAEGCGFCDDFWCFNVTNS